MTGDRSVKFDVAVRQLPPDRRLRPARSLLNRAAAGNIGARTQPMELKLPEDITSWNVTGVDAQLFAGPDVVGATISISVPGIRHTGRLEMGVGIAEALIIVLTESRKRALELQQDAQSGRSNIDQIGRPTALSSQVRADTKDSLVLLLELPELGMLDLAMPLSLATTLRDQLTTTLALLESTQGWRH